MSNTSPAEIIKEIEQAQVRKDIPEFRAGDTVKVFVKVKEGSRERLQAFEGVVIRKRRSDNNMNAGFTVRKIAGGEGVERTFQTHSKKIDRVEVVRFGKVRQGKIYYMRELQGKKARIKSDLKRQIKKKSAKKAG